MMEITPGKFMAALLVLISLLVGGMLYAVFVCQPQQECPDTNGQMPLWERDIQTNEISCCCSENTCSALPHRFEPEISFECEPDQNRIEQITCTQYGIPFPPAIQTQEFIAQVYPNALCGFCNDFIELFGEEYCSNNQNIIFCQDCTETRNVGYTCIESEFVER